MKEYLKNRITRYWENAKIDYDIDGEFISIKENGDTLLITWVEMGTQYTMPIHYYKDYSAEQVFNIWMESDWSFYAD